MPSAPMVVIDNRSQQHVQVSVVDDSGKIVPYPMPAGTHAEPIRYDQVTQHTHQLAAKGLIALRYV